MIQFPEVVLQQLIVHRVGNKSIDEGYKLSDSAIELNQYDDLSAILTGFFLKPFEQTPLFHFTHATSLELNEIYTIASKMFARKGDFVVHSKEIGKILYEYSMHPKIKNGELYIAHFGKCKYNEQEVDAIGIFKSENKETFLKLNYDGRNYLVDFEDGVNINKLEKGCLILNTDKENGYVVAIVDKTSRGEEAQYWKDEFLKIKPSNDNYHATQHYLEACKHFVTDQLEQEFEVQRTDKIGYLNKTVDYFKKNEAFNEGEFLNEVFEDKEVIQSFSKFKDEYAQDTGNELAGSFDISEKALKKQARVFKSVLKLDKNFHVYIHGDKSLIEKGYDATVGKHFYKIFFDEEN